MHHTIKKEIEGDRRGKKKNWVRHGVRCKNGQHRSTAVAELAGTALRDLGYEVVVQHLSYEPCGCPEACSSLTGLSTEEASAQQGGWAADGHAAHVLASRLYHAVM